MVFCAAFNCSNSSKTGVSFFKFPLNDEKRCKEWLRLMRRKDFKPTTASRLCSVHFSPDSFVQNLELMAQLGFKPGKVNLKPDALPTIFDFTNKSEKRSLNEECTTNTEGVRSAFVKRRKLEMLEELLREPEPGASEIQATGVETDGEIESLQSTERTGSRFQCQFTVNGRLRPKEPTAAVDVASSSQTEVLSAEPDKTATPTTPSETQLTAAVDVDRPSQREILSTKKRSQPTQTRRREYRSIHTQTTVIKTFSSAVQCSLIEENSPDTETAEKEGEVDEDEDDDLEDYSDDHGESDEEWTPDVCKEDIKSEEEIGEDGSTTDSEEANAPFGRKFLVFESSLLELFQHCPTCFAPSVPKIEKIVGTMVMIESKCSKGHKRIWTSQSLDGMLPWGNMLCAAATLFTGSNPGRVATFFKHLGMSYISLRTYYYLQQLYLIPAVNRVWKSEQLSLLTAFQGKVIDVGGDARCDSPGHCAKYGTYHLVELDTNKVLTVELVQSNEVKNSYHMELEGLKRGLAVIKSADVTIKTLITDRHSGIKKYIRENEKEIDHRFDCWHLSTNVSKKVEALAKKKNCSILGNWKQSISNHLYWCAASSGGDGKLVQAKWLSITNHVINVHEGHSPSFPECAHGPLEEERVWVKKGSKAHKELESVISKKFLLNDIAKISPSHQTSLVEVLHKIDIYFAPKHTHFFYQGMKARLQIAALHFNENSDKPQRKIVKGENVGSGQWLVSYPKYRKGGAVAKEIKEACTYGYVARLFDSVRERRQQLPSYSAAQRDIQPVLQAIPKPLTSQQTRQVKEAVVARHKSRFNKN